MRGQFALNLSESQHLADTETSGVAARGQRADCEPEAFQRFSDRFCRFRTMAKVWSVGVIVALTLLIVLGILAESLSAQKAKPKVLVKRRKIVSTTTVAPEPEIEAISSLPPIQRSVEAQAFALPVTGSSVPQQRYDSNGGDAIITNAGEIENGRSSDPAQCSPTCDTSKCATDINCHIGLIRDRCDCCNVCAVGEGTRCYNSSNAVGTVGASKGICGPGLLCSNRMDLEPDEPMESLCECRNKQSVCGSDNVTYSSECKLREASHLKRNLTIASWTSCVSAPWLSTPMENVTGAIGADLSVSCEFRSFPASIIHWEFAPDNSRNSRERLVLPGDDPSVIQTNRGGPEEMMTTSWIQIVSASPKHQGIYYCFAKNTEGTSQSYAYVSVYSELRI